MDNKIVRLAAAGVLLVAAFLIVRARRSAGVAGAPTADRPVPGIGPDPSVGPDPSAGADPNVGPDKHAGSR